MVKVFQAINERANKYCKEVGSNFLSLLEICFLDLTMASMLQLNHSFISRHNFVLLNVIAAATTLCFIFMIILIAYKISGMHNFYLKSKPV